MKKNLNHNQNPFCHKLSLVVALSVLMESNAFASTKTSTLTISALVEELVSISITPKGNYSNLDIHTTQTDVPVATVFESSNSSKGYIVKARSENNGQIKNLSGGDSVVYHLKYGGSVPFNLSQTDQVLSDQSVGGVFSSAGKDVTISFQGMPATKLSSGTYRDIITFIIESK